MSSDRIDSIRFTPGTGDPGLLARILDPHGSPFVLIHRIGIDVDDAVLRSLAVSCAAPLAATVSPVPSEVAPQDRVSVVDVHERSPEPPSLAMPCLDAFLLHRDAVRSVEWQMIDANGDPEIVLASLARQLLESGWRHVVAPGAALDWRPRASTPVGAGWSASTEVEAHGRSNSGLATAVAWSAYQLRGPRIIVDGACLTDTPHNGSQKLVTNVVQWLQRTRPDAVVAVAAVPRHVDHVRDQLGRHGIEVVPRTAVATRFDLVYRPYQLLDPSEVAWLEQAGERLLVGQLDMIGFANPSYHPSPALFHAVRNLQRRTMRMADGVVFISRFGLRTAHAECPDLDARRMFVVSCGTESDPASTAPTTDLPRQPFTLCLSARFLHKNRPHALRVFERMCGLHAYGGDFIIAGPEPHYGSSSSAEQHVIDSMDRSVASRIRYLGQIDEATKWALLRAADLVLYPSVVEGFGLVPFEAATAGTPSLSYAGSGLAELIGDAECLIGTWDADAWADRCVRLIADGPARAASIEALQRASRSHTWEQVARSTWEAIDATIASAPVRPEPSEGGWTSRMAPPAPALARAARMRHFVHRVAAALRRRAGAIRATGAAPR